MFCIKDEDCFGMSKEFIADAFLQFSDIEESTQNGRHIHPMNLKLSAPGSPQEEGENLRVVKFQPRNFICLLSILESLEPIKSIRNRSNDKQAKEFLKNLRLKFEESQTSKGK
jgi:hypothetical protein